MPIKDYLTADRVFLNGKFNSYDEVLHFLSQEFSGSVDMNKDGIYDLFKKREDMGTTWIGESTVLPHNHNSAISGIHIIFIRCEKPVTLPDGNQITYVFSILTSGSEDQSYLGILQGISKLIQKTRTEIDACERVEDFIQLIDESEYLDVTPIRASDLAQEWPTIKSDEPISKALDLMKKHNIYFLPVICPESNRLCGVLDLVDLLKAGFPDYVFSLSDLSLIQDFKPIKYFWKKEDELFVKAFTRDFRPYIVSDDASYPEIFFLMIKGNRRHLLVLDENEKLVGIIHPTQIIDRMLRP